MRRATFCLASILLLWPAIATAATLERLEERGEIRIGYRQDAVPFSCENELGEAAGFSVDLCRAVAARLEADLGLERLDVAYVPVSTEDRFEAVAEGRIDLLCGATTATLARRETIDFSIATFVDGASVLFRADGPGDVQGLADGRVGVRGGTTTQDALGSTLEDMNLDVEIVTVPSHDEGLRLLEDGEILAYFADRAILQYLAMASETPQALRLSERYYTVEPYAIGLPKGDDAFRLAVDRALSHIYRSGEIERLFTTAFGPDAEPSELVKALYVISALPE